MPDRARPAHAARLVPSLLTALLSALLLFGLSFAVTPGTAEGATTATAACGA